ncbi:DNA repair protein Rev1 [Eurosta solidaginis]|uniref:DNA repair protein Rev1 n=1 Tax=Eurosta solidaginis TaxID=178769 RepID=UPI003531532D
MGGNGFEQWGGYMEAKITKLEDQFSASSNPYRQSNLFQGISIYVNGLTNPSADELKRIMMVHGGTYHHYERSHTTYIIATNLPNVKVRNMNTSKIISPQWVVDSVKEMHVLDYTRYLLYTNQKNSQPRLVFKRSDQDKSQSENDLKLDNQLTTKEGNGADKQIKEFKIPTGTTLEKQTSKELARTAVDPKFLSEFYNNSRLHHIATLGAGFKQYVTDLREKCGDCVDFPARRLLKEHLLLSGIGECKRISAVTWIMHIDMDCFFVSVGLRKYPELRGQPVAVTHSKGGASANQISIHPDVDRKTEMELLTKRFEQHLHNNILSDKVRGGFEAQMSLSEIASCSYEARAKGIRNGMFVGKALNLCPELKTIPYDFEGYREVAYTLYDTVAQYTLNIEAVSCDEMFVDLTDVLDEMRVEPMDFVLAVREEVRKKTGCPCSAGVGGNKLQARMATKRAKPDGQYQLHSDAAQEYMADIKIEELPGVGSSTTYTLKQHNLVTCGDLQKISLLKLQMHVGKKFGETLYQFCRGNDNRPLSYGQIRKSVSAEVNYGIRFKEYSELETFLRQLSTEVHNRLNDIKRRTKCVTLKLMMRSKDAPLEAAKFMGHGVCDHITKSVSLSEYTCDIDVITRTVLTTMKSLELAPNELRGIGIQLSKLNDPNEGKERKENMIMNMFSKIAVKQKDKSTDPLHCDNRDINKTASDLIETKKHEPEDGITKLIKSKTDRSAKVIGKRGRGKIATDSSVNKKSKKSTNILDLIKQKVSTKPIVASKCTTEDNSNANIPNNIDLEVFAALPSDIRAEILKSHNDVLQNITSNDITSLPPPPASAKTNVSILNESDFQPSTSKAAQLKQQCKDLLKLQRNLKPTSKTEECTATTTVTTNAIQHLDPEFLAALPQDLRIEIEREYAHIPMECDTTQHQHKVANSTDRFVGKFAITPKMSDDNIFMQENCEELLLAWLKSADVPEKYDIDLMAMHAGELVCADEIDRLYTPIIYLCRVLNQQKRSGAPNDCLWHTAYLRIVKSLQKEMEKCYDGRQLFLGEKLKWPGKLAISI